MILIEIGAAFIAALLAGFLGHLAVCAIKSFAQYRLFPRYISGESIGRIESGAYITILGLLILESVGFALLIAESALGLLVLASLLLLVSVLSFLVPGLVAWARTTH